MYVTIYAVAKTFINKKKLSNIVTQHIKYKNTYIFDDFDATSTNTMWLTFNQIIICTHN